VIEAGDHTIVFVNDKRILRMVEKQIQVNSGFF
jgi:hypothetical protein